MKEEPKLAVVTGASQGLGRQIAIGLIERGDRVIAISRSQVKLTELKADLGDRVFTYCGDVSDLDFVLSMSRTVIATLGDPDILINAAGVFGPIAQMEKCDPKEWAQTISINAIAPFYLIHQFLPGMLANKWGRIINVSSAAALHVPGPLNSAYGTSKVALNQMTRHLASEIAGTGVCANVIHPGDVLTGMWADIAEKAGALGVMGASYTSWVDWVAQTGGDNPSKAMDLVLELISEAGAHINGHFCWVKDPLQKPIPSWDVPTTERPWN